MHIDQQFDLSGKVAIITGASKGIGKAIAKALAQKGAQVVVSSRRQEAIDAVVQEFNEEGLKASAIACHMGDNEQVQALAQTTIDTYGGVDIIINNDIIRSGFKFLTNETEHHLSQFYNSTTIRKP